MRGKVCEFNNLILKLDHRRFFLFQNPSNNLIPFSSCYSWFKSRHSHLLFYNARFLVYFIKFLIIKEDFVNSKMRVIMKPRRQTSHGQEIINRSFVDILPKVFGFVEAKVIISMYLVRKVPEGDCCMKGSDSSRQFGSWAFYEDIWFQFSRRWLYGSAEMFEKLNTQNFLFLNLRAVKQSNCISGIKANCYSLSE